MWEGLSDWGEAVCAACPNSNIIITAGSSTVVCVWNVSFSKDKLKYMKLKQVRYSITHKCLLITKNMEKEYIFSICLFCFKIVTPLGIYALSMNICKFQYLHKAKAKGTSHVLFYCVISYFSVEPDMCENKHTGPFLADFFH